MKSSWLRHQITIQRDTGTASSVIGEDLPVWEDFITLRASVEPLHGNEAINLRMQGAEITTRIRTWYVAGVKPAMRVLFCDDVYNILEVYSPLEKRVELMMLCRKDAD